MAFSKNTHTVLLDLKRRNGFIPLVVEGDTANRIAASIRDNGNAVDLTGLHARAVFRRSDGRVVYQSDMDAELPASVSISGSDITIDVKNSSFRDGDNEMEIQIIAADRQTVMITTQRIILRGRNCLMTEDAVLASTEMDALQQTLNELVNLGLTVTALEPDASATGSITHDSTGYHMALGLPKGQKGDTGAQGAQGETGATGADGQDAPIITSITTSGGNLIIALSDGSSYSVSVPGVTVDSAISSTSENPVQNKVIYAQFVSSLATVQAMIADMATQTWVNNQGFAEESDIPDLSDYATHSDVESAVAGLYSLPDNGIPASDMTAAVQTSLGKADTAYQKPSGGIPAADLASGVIPDISGKQDTANLVTSLSSASTDTQYPSAKCVYDIVGDIETLLASI